MIEVCFVDGLPVVKAHYAGWEVEYDGFGSFKLWYFDYYAGRIEDKVFFLPSGQMRLLRSDMFVIQQVITAISELEI